MNNKLYKLPFSEKLGYGLGDFGSSMFYKLFSTFLVYFYTDIFRINAAAVATMILVTRFWDAANDPIMGIVADRTNTRWGKFRPYLLWISLPFAIIGIACFSSPDLTDAGKLTYAYITYTLMMMIYTAINVPYSSLIGVMTSHSDERTKLASFRYFFAFAGGILVQATLLHLVPILDENNLNTGWQKSIAIYAFIAMGAFITTFFLVKERVKPITGQNNKLKHDLFDLLRNNQWFILLGVSVTMVIFNQLREGAAVYYFKYYMSEKDVILFNKSIHFDYINLSALLIPLWTASNLLGVLLAKPIAKIIGKKRTFLICMVISLVASFVYFTIQPHQYIYLLFLQIIVGLAAGIPLVLSLTMFADIADYSEYKTGRRATALIFSSVTMSQKFGSTLGIALTGYILAIAGYQPETITADSQIGIRLLMSVVPGIAAALSILLFLFYKLDDRFMSEISKKLVTLRE